MSGGFEVWLFTYAGKKGADSLVNRLQGEDLISKLHKAIDSWGKRLPEESSLQSEYATYALFPADDSDPEKRPALKVLRLRLLDGRVPPKQMWFAALHEQWLQVANRSEESAAFFTLPEEVARKHLEELAQELTDVCSRDGELFAPTAFELFQEILDWVRCDEDPELQQADNELSDAQKKLLLRLYQFDGRCGIWAAKGELECLWVPGFQTSMQWGWERTAQEAALSGKAIGNRDERIGWILVVQSLVDLNLLEKDPEVSGRFNLTTKGWQVAYQLSTAAQ